MPVNIFIILEVSSKLKNFRNNVQFTLRIYLNMDEKVLLMKMVITRSLARLALSR